MEDRAAMARFIGDLHTRGTSRASLRGRARSQGLEAVLAERFQGASASRPRLLLPRGRPQQADPRGFRAHVLRVLKLNGDDDAKAGRAHRRHLAIETELAKASMTALQRRDLEKTTTRWPAELERIAPASREGLLRRPARGQPGKHVVRPARVLYTASRSSGTRNPPPTGALPALAPAARYFRPARYALRVAAFRPSTRRLCARAQMPSRSKRVLDIISGGLGTEPCGGLGQLYVERTSRRRQGARAGAWWRT